MPKSGTAAGAATGAAAGVAVGAAADGGFAPSTSALTMRPFGPEPLTPARSTPLSAAIRLASGLATTRSPFAAGAAAGAATGPGAATGTGAAVADGAGSAALAAGTGALASSSSPAIVAITVPTFTPSLPSATSIDTTVPSSTASNSIVALSVSISAMMSPDKTLSPTLISHFASVPSSIVGERAGILIAIGMGAFSVS